MRTRLRCDVGTKPRGCHRFQREGDTACIEVQPTESFRMRLIGVDHCQTSRHDLAEQSGFSSPLLDQYLGWKTNRHRNVGHDRCMKGNALERALCERLAGDFKYTCFAAMLDHLGEEGRQIGCSGREMTRRLGSLYRMQPEVLWLTPAWLAGLVTPECGPKPTPRGRIVLPS